MNNISELLNQIQQDMLSKAEFELKENIVLCRAWSECACHLAAKRLLLLPFCGHPSCEDNIKRDTAKYKIQVHKMKLIYVSQNTFNCL